MLNLIPIDRKPLENPKGHLYSRMAFDGIYFYCCTGKSSKIFKFNIDGKLLNCLSSKRVYCSICFDCNENCFWAIVSTCHNLIFKLDKDFCEITCISFYCKDACFHNISYDVSRDMLILCSESMVLKVSKSGLVIPLYSEDQGVQHEAAVQMLDSCLIACKFQIGCPDIIGILLANNCFEYLCCLPKQFLLKNICVCYGHGGFDTVFVLAVQNYKYSYLLSYRVEYDEKIEYRTALRGETVDGNQMISVSIDGMDVQTDIIIQTSEVQ